MKKGPSENEVFNYNYSKIKFQSSELVKCTKKCFNIKMTNLF